MGLGGSPPRTQGWVGPPAPPPGSRNPPWASLMNVAKSEGVLVEASYRYHSANSWNAFLKGNQTWLSSSHLMMGKWDADTQFTGKVTVQWAAPQYRLDTAVSRAGLQGHQWEGPRLPFRPGGSAQSILSNPPTARGRLSGHKEGNIPHGSSRLPEAPSTAHCLRPVTQIAGHSKGRILPCGLPLSKGFFPFSLHFSDYTYNIVNIEKKKTEKYTK